MSIRHNSAPFHGKPVNRLHQVLLAGQTATHSKDKWAHNPREGWIQKAVDSHTSDVEDMLKRSEFYSRYDPNDTEWNKALEILRDWKNNLPREEGQSTLDWLRGQLKSAEKAEDSLADWYGVRNSTINLLIRSFTEIIKYFEKEVNRPRLQRHNATILPE